jgi:hypothetical protein
MRFTSEKLKKLIESSREILKDPEKRKLFLEKAKHSIKGFVAVSVLIAFLTAPHIGRAEAPLELPSRSSFSYSVMKQYYDSDQLTLDRWCEELGISQEELDDVAYYLNVFFGGEGERYETLIVGNRAYLEKNHEENETLLEENEETILANTYNGGVFIETPINPDLHNKIKESQNLVIYDIPDEVKSPVPRDVPIVFTLEQRTRSHKDYPEYLMGTYSHIFNDKSELSSLSSEYLVYMTIEAFREFDITQKPQNGCKICLALTDYTTLSTEEAKSLVGMVDFVRLNPNTSQGEREATEIYSLQEYIELSEGLDRIIDSINPNAPQIERLGAAYFELAAKTYYDTEESQKKEGREGREGPFRRKEVGNARGAIVEGKGVCIGIAESLVALYQRMGYEARIYAGYDDGTIYGHAICEVRLEAPDKPEMDGKWIQLDATWDIERMIKGWFGSLVGFGHNHYHFDNPVYSSVQEPIENLYFMDDAETEELFRRIAEERGHPSTRRPISLPSIKMLARARLQNLLWDAMERRANSEAEYWNKILEDLENERFDGEAEWDEEVDWDDAPDVTPREDLDEK